MQYEFVVVKAAEFPCFLFAVENNLFHIFFW